MADRESIRNVVLSKAFRRSIFGILALLAIWFVYRSLRQGSVADRCSDSLLDAIARRDTAYLSQHVRNPSLAEQLAGVQAELLFVRPVDPEWSRIGLAVRSSATATSARPVYVLLSHQESQRDCTFLQDYDAHL
jgi:hypothetical protein